MWDAGNGTQPRRYLLNVRSEHRIGCPPFKVYTLQEYAHHRVGMPRAHNVLRKVLRSASHAGSRGSGMTCSTSHSSIGASTFRSRRFGHASVCGPCALSLSSLESAHRHHSHVHLGLVAVPAGAVEGRRRATGSQTRVSDRRKRSKAHEAEDAR